MVVLGASIIGVIMWLAKSDYRGAYDRYYVFTKESVSGLSVNSTVKYQGVDVGRVKDIILNPDDPEEVKITLDILRDTPVKTDTKAILVTQGLTGLVTLNLTGGSRDAPPLTAKDGHAYPVIDSAPSLFGRVDMAISRLLSDQGLSQLLANLNALSKSAGSVLDDQNRALLKRTLEDVSEITRTVAERNDRLDRGLVSAAEAAENLAKMTASLNREIPALMARIGKSAAAVQTMTEELASTSQAVGQVVRESRPGIRQFTQQTLSETGQLVAELRQLTNTLQQVARQLEQDPNALVFGRRAGTRGPGE